MRRGEIASIVEHAAPLDRQPSERVLRMLKVSQQYGGSSAHAAMLLANKLDALSDQRGLQWHANSLLWWSLVRLHLTEEEQVIVILALAPTGKKRRGFTSTSLVLYQRQPADLSLAEVATIIALIRMPSARAGMLEQTREMLLARYEACFGRRDSGEVLSLQDQRTCK
jgi:membrane carboxypeptidase/penicillin-binding protein PbpC